MSLLRIDKAPPERVLRQFAIVWLPAAAALIGWAIVSRGGAWSAAILLWSVTACLAVAGALKPRVVRPIFTGWMRAVYPIAWTISHLALAFVFYAVITPIGLVARLLGHDPMQRGFDRQAPSYWVRRARVTSPDRYFRQF